MKNTLSQSQLDLEHITKEFHQVNKSLNTAREQIRVADDQNHNLSLNISSIKLELITEKNFSKELEKSNKQQVERAQTSAEEKIARAVC